MTDNMFLKIFEKLHVIAFYMINKMGFEALKNL